MKIVKVLVVGVVLLSGIYLALCFTGPQEMKVAVQREMALPAHEVRAWDGF